MNGERLVVPLAAVLVAICHANETMAYRFVGAPVLDKPLAECPVLKQTPEPTPFVKPGDELRDLTPAFRESKIPLENSWVIWNQTQHLLVVHAAILDQWRIEKIAGFDGQPRHVKLTVDWIRSENPGNASGGRDSVFASVGVFGQSGMKFSASSQAADATGEWSFSVEAEATIGSTLDLIDNRLDITWKGPEGGSVQHGKISGNQVLRHGEPQPVASWNIVGNGPAWRVTVKGEVLLADGTAWRDARLREDGKPVEIRPNPVGERKWVKLAELPGDQERNLLAMRVSRDDIRALASDAPKDDADPFADSPNEPPPLAGMPDAVIPAALQSFLGGPLLDLRPLFRTVGINGEGDDFIAYEPISERVILSCKGRRLHDMIEALMMTMDCGVPYSPIQCEAWLADAAEPGSPLAKISLLGRAGTRAQFELLDAKDQAIAWFEVEPTRNAENTAIELRHAFHCRLPSPAKADWQSNSAVTLANGIPLLTDAARLPDGRLLKQGLRATIGK
jgi:hypothetical protein